MKAKGSNGGLIQDLKEKNGVYFMQKNQSTPLLVSSIFATPVDEEEIIETLKRLSEEVQNTNAEMFLFRENERN